MSEKVDIVFYCVEGLGKTIISLIIESYSLKLIDMDFL